MVDVVDTNTSVTVSFGGGERSALVIFAGHTGYCNIFEWICYRVYPHDVIDIRTNAGTIDRSADVVVENHTEYLTFNNTNTANLQFPAYGEPAVTFDVYFDTAGATQAFGDKGVIGGKGLSATFNKDANQIVASEAFFGLATVTYQTTYRVWHYVPQIDENGTFSHTNADYSIKTTYGMLAALYNGSITTFNTSPLDKGGGNNQQYEVYRVTSEAVNNANGAWERHKEFPTKTWSDEGAPQNNSAYMTYERVHEIGVLTGSSRSLAVHQYHVRNENPHKASTVWKPQYKATFDDGKGTLETVYEEAWASLDLNDIRADLRKRYPGITGANLVSAV